MVSTGFDEHFLGIDPHMISADIKSASHPAVLRTASTRSSKSFHLTSGESHTVEKAAANLHVAGAEAPEGILIKTVNQSANARSHHRLSGDARVMSDQLFAVPCSRAGSSDCAHPVRFVHAEPSSSLRQDQQPALPGGSNHAGPIDLKLDDHWLKETLTLSDTAAPRVELDLA